MNARLDERAFATPRVLCKDLGDEAILLDLETETYFGLNAAGSRLFKLLTTTPTIRDAFAAMLDEYDVTPDELERDIDRKSTRLNSSHTIQSRMPSSA